MSWEERFDGVEKVMYRIDSRVYDIVQRLSKVETKASVLGAVAGAFGGGCLTLMFKLFGG